MSTLIVPWRFVIPVMCAMVELGLDGDVIGIESAEYSMVKFTNADDCDVIRSHLHFLQLVENN